MRRFLPANRFPLLLVSSLLAFGGVEAQTPASTTVEINVLRDYPFTGIPFAAGAVTRACRLEPRNDAVTWTLHWCDRWLATPASR